jgi:hypothetical protein
MFFAAVFMIAEPVATLPVKLKRPTSGWLHSASPVVRPEP